MKSDDRVSFRGSLALLAWLGLGGLLGYPATAHALPALLTIDPGTTASLTVVDPYPGGPESVTITGDVTGDVGFAGLAPDSFQATGGSLLFGDATFLLDTPPGLVLTIDTSNVGGTLTGPVVTGFPIGLDRSLFDFRDYTITLDTGLLVATGDVYGSPVDFTLDLGAEPLTFVFPINSIGEATGAALGNDQIGLGLRIPFDLETDVVVAGILTRLDFAGQIEMSAAVTVPEPGTGCLLAAGLALLSMRRRLRRSSTAQSRLRPTQSSSA